MISITTFMACVSPSLLFFIISSFPIISSLTVPAVLSHFQPNPSQDPRQNLNYLVSSSLTRALHLKNPQIEASTQLFSHSYGGYSISLSFGTPPQTIPFVMDTGSDLVWFPCTSRYLCKNCSFSPLTTTIPSFIPNRSSSSKIIGCRNPKCSWIHPREKMQCEDCPVNSHNCTQICPSYLIMYGSGMTGGIALSETLNLPHATKPDFLVGCSVISTRQPAGIAGFGRGKASLPSQLNLNKFSYCLLSHKFDDTTRSSSLVLDTGSDSGQKTSGVTYTPFISNPRVPGMHSFLVYYYVGLRRITVGGRRVKAPYRYLTADSDGNGGTIIDSGTTFTYMAPEVFEPLVSEFEAQVMKKSNYSRALDVEGLTGLRPCYKFSTANSSAKVSLTFPEMKLQFKGGAEVALPLENYVVVFGDGDSSAACLTMVSGGLSGGPAIILGNFLLQNYYVEYDLRNERLGLKQQPCK